MLSSEQAVGVEQRRRYPAQDRKAPILSTFSSFVPSQDNDEPLINDALKKSDSGQWKADIRKEISTLQNMQCSTLASRPTARRTLLSKIVLQCKRNEQSEVVKYKARPAVCRNEDHNFHDESFSLVADRTIAKMMTSKCLRQGW